MKLAHVTITTWSQFISRNGIERERWNELEREKEVPLRVYSGFVKVFFLLFYFFFFFKLVTGTALLFFQNTEKASIHKHIFIFVSVLEMM